MRTKLHYALLMLCLLGYSGYAQSLSPDSVFVWKAGIGAGLVFNNHQTGFTQLPNVPSCAPLFSNGSGSGIQLSAFFGLALQSPWSLHLGLEYTQLNGQITATQQQLVDDNGAREATIEYAIQTRVSSVALSPELSYAFGPLSLHAGARVGMLLKPSYVQSEKIVAPNTIVFENDRRDRMNFSGDVDQSSGMELSVKLGLRSSLPLSSDKKWSCEPSLYYTYMLSNLLATPDPWKIHSAQFGVSIVYTKRNEPAPELPPPPVPEVKPEPKEPVIAVIPKPKKTLVVGRYEPVLRDTNSNLIDRQLIIRNTISQNTYAMINYVFFDSASAQLPSRYKLLSPSESKRFQTNELNATSTLEIYYNILNLVGKRMQEDAKTKIVLVGCNASEGSEKNNLALSRARAESIKNYLTNVWQVEASRISIQARNLPESPSNSSTTDGVEENRRVEIRTESSELLEPLIFSDTVCTINAGSISYPGMIQPGVVVRSWSLDITNNGKVVTTFGSQGSLPTDIVWDTRKDRERIQRMKGTLSAKLKVIDEDGQVLETDAEAINIQQQRVRNSTIQRFSLITFAFNASTMSKADRHIISIIRKNITPKSTVYVSGYTDRLGDPVHNQQLSEQRALQVAKVLGVPPENARGEGAANQMYDNNTPEGRFYSRTVIVTIETPLE